MVIWNEGEATFTHTTQGQTLFLKEEKSPSKYPSLVFKRSQEPLPTFFIIHYAIPCHSIISRYCFLNQRYKDSRLAFTRKISVSDSAHL